jgi:hypothetical protein
MRGFRPSYFHLPSEDVDDDREQNKQENLLQYIARVREGLPLFEGDRTPQQIREIPLQS